MKTSVYTAHYDALRKWLKMNREAQGLSLRDVSALWGRHHSVLGKIEQSRRKVELVEFIELCSILEADPHEGLSLLQKSLSGTNNKTRT
ncbi:helix-turn-helix domain-containing protein [Alteromonas portus]|jgi:predicted transcriptional regulator|uniref:helix-turn-helix domain-containing protein n=1 Tax=Alteromonas portus TaxID=2565549 RepID=UPI003BF8C031